MTFLSESEAKPQDKLEGRCNELRGEIQKIADDVLVLKGACAPLPDEIDRGECIANVMLSYRHLEDARMRLGKVMQQLQGGVSIYDREKAT